MNKDFAIYYVDLASDKILRKELILRLINFRLNGIQDRNFNISPFLCMIQMNPLVVPTNKKTSLI